MSTDRPDTLNPDTRHAVVLGGAGGIGQAVALRLAQDGYSLSLLGRSAERLTEAARALTETTGCAVQALPCDLCDLPSLQGVFAQIPRIDVLVNAAGSIPRKALHETAPADWEGAWSAKVLGAIEATRLASQTMRSAGGGVIVQIIGISGVKLNPKTILTTTANAALIAFTEAFGAQSVDWNVRVVGINPGLTETPRTADLRAGQGSDAYQAALANLPLQRMARAEEIADCAAFLASDRARYISGTVIDIDAGTRWRT